MTIQEPLSNIFVKLKMDYKICTGVAGVETDFNILVMVAGGKIDYDIKVMLAGVEIDFNILVTVAGNLWHLRHLLVITCLERNKRSLSYYKCS